VQGALWAPGWDSNPGGSLSRYRKVEVGSWTDAKIRAISWPPPNGLTLWHYLLSGPRTIAIPGVVVAREAIMADDLRWPLEGFREAFAEVFARGLVEVDVDAGLVVLAKALIDAEGRPRKTAVPQSANVVIAWAKAWQDVPDCDLKNRTLLERLGKFCGLVSPKIAKAFGEAFREAIAKASPTQDTGSRKQEAGGKKIPRAPAKPSQPRVVVAPDPDAFLLADLLRGAVLAAKPNHRIGDDGSWQPTRRAWAKTLAGTLRRRPRPQLEAAIGFLQSQVGQPYAFVVESARSLDEKLDKIELAMVRVRDVPRKNGNGHGYYHHDGTEEYVTGKEF